ncbi:MAG TPA: hypothetical protein VKY40_00215 [Halanaerobiales bacterium]|nr:hypothetical protein [Halanaerobiales bacterium]
MRQIFLIIMIILLLSTGVLADGYKDKYVQLLDQGKYALRLLLIVWRNSIKREKGLYGVSID